LDSLDLSDFVEAVIIPCQSSIFCIYDAFESKKATISQKTENENSDDGFPAPNDSRNRDYGTL
jgi:hypothetical protein